jgi:hypothetical protein
VVPFDEADLLRPAGVTAGVFLGGRVPLDGGSLSLELGHDELETHSEKSIPLK